MSKIIRKWTRLPMLWRLIIVNVAVFLVIRLLGIIALVGAWDINVVINCLAMPSTPAELAREPWTVLTYMVTHYDVFHILFNMLTLYWFGKLMTIRCTPRQIVGLYILGGIAGAAVYFAAAQIFPAVNGYLLGASASVIAIVIAPAVLMPDMEIALFLIGRVKLKWVAVGAAVLFALGLVGNNPGGHVAHIGGLLCGLAFGLSLRHGVDITSPLNKLLDAIANLWKRLTTTTPRRRKNLRPKRRKTASDNARFHAQSGQNSSNKRAPRASATVDNQEILNAILDKIKKSGYSALTPEERGRLFDVSSRIK